MKMIGGAILGGIILVMLQASAVALPIEITPDSSFLLLVGGDTSVPAIEAAIDAYFMQHGLCCDLEGVYKQDVPEEGESVDDVGSYADSYVTEFFNDPNDPEEAAITWVPGTPYIEPMCSFLLVKDGNRNPAWYFFDLYSAGWDGMETLELSEFWPAQGAISHVGIYDCTRSVPDGGVTIALLGLGLVALGIVSRRVRR
jgi:hypothetical protein